MQSYEFTIVATGLSVDDTDWEGRLYEAGCDDALVTLTRGLFVLRFDREAASIEEAIRSAIRDVTSTGARVIRVEPDPLASASDIADRSGLSRQLVSLYANGNRGAQFPLPATHASTSKPQWRWSEVAAWLHSQGKLIATELAAAQAIERANAGLGAIDGVASGQQVAPLARSTTNLSPFAKIESYAQVNSAFAGQEPKFRTQVARHAMPRPFDLNPVMEVSH
ncbi:hypothetical protein [Qipengyuania sediminis]|uniref:hypothetical protein n=1 Tax=Qipengyuania sediminis TaxID=1532023 RepID=UPI001059E5B0|nr:hypothetical protein [Qipengyuania sediminis]